METEKFKNKYRVQSSRKENYNYASEGFYFVTICVKNKQEMLFGNIIDGKMNLSEIGKIAENYWQEIPKHFPFVKLDEFIVMPNHIHGIIGIRRDAKSCVSTDAKSCVSTDAKSCVSTDAKSCVSTNINVEYKNRFGPQSKNLSSIIRGYKAAVRKYAVINNINFAWQPRFFDRIIRNDYELNRTRQYIIDNPEKWETDRNNPIFSVHDEIHR